jgi:peroxiredoxin
LFGQTDNQSLGDGSSDTSMASREQYTAFENRELTRSPECWRALTSLLALAFAAAPHSVGARAASAATKGEVSFPGRVVAVENGKPIAGASVVVERVLPGLPASLIPPWAGQSTLTTDRDGRFILNFPPEQVAERRLSIALRVTHPGYIGRRSSTLVPLVEIVLGRQGGDPSFFETIKLARGLEYTGQAVTPGGQPGVGATFEFVHWAEDGNSSDHFVDETKGKTDSEGRFRLRAPKTHQLAIYVTPAAHAPFQRFWGPDEPDKEPDLWVPTDLGRLVLSPGIPLSGRLLDLKGRPIAGESITAQSVYSRHERTAKTKPDGRFTFAPLRPGNYIVFGQGQGFGGGFDANARSLPPQGTVFPPAKVYLKDGIVPAPVTLREMATITVETRFVDSAERPTRGSFVGLWGQIAVINNPQVMQEAIFEGEGLSASINGAEREDKSPQPGWSTQLIADATGRLSLRAPKGLQNVQLFSMPPNETIAIRNRLGAGKPLNFWGGGAIDDLKADLRGVAFVLYDSPMILANVKTEDGESPAVNIQVNASFTSAGVDYGAGFVEQADGKYRSQNLMPGQEYEISAWATGFIPIGVRRLTLAEGAATHLTLTVKRQPTPLKVGDFAPPFLVKTIAGEGLALADLRGKLVLLHFWNPVDDNCLPDLARLNAVRARFGNDDRLAMIGLCVVADSAAVTKIIKEKALSWPQVMLRDRAADSIVLEYDAAEVPKLFLIAPDGRVVARDLGGGDVEDAVAKALKGK